MPKTIISNTDRLLRKITNLGNQCGFLLIIGYVLLSILSAILDPNFDQQRLVQEFGPLIVAAIGVSTLCLLLQMMLRTDSTSG
ncbi:hypothetical protein [Pseudomonas syringae]|uniref:hypothetical protein n=1 Tax=Pseudomonas syringae TaxID=317 RepID=UPI003CEA1653